MQDEMGWICSTLGESDRYGYQLWPANLEGAAWEVAVEMGLGETGCDGVDWIELAQDRVQWWPV
jgi:hypothetical protein